MAQAQERFDWMLPPSYAYADDDNADAAWNDAVENATERELSCGAAVADVLSAICDPLVDGRLPGRDEIKVGELCQTSPSNRDDFDPSGQPPHVLLAVVMLGGDVSAMRALRYLREAVAEAMGPAINSAAEKMLAQEVA